MHSFTHSFTHSVTHSHSSPLFLCFGCAENRRKRSVQRLLLRERKHTHTHMRRPLSFPQSSHESTVLCESRHHDSNKSQHSNTNMQANKQTISTLTEAKDKHHAVQERESARDVCARARVCVCVCVCVCTASYFFDFFGTQFMYPLQLYAPQRHTTLFSSSSGN